MGSLEATIDQRSKKRPDIPSELLRSKIRKHSKNFKTSWVNLGQIEFGMCHKSINVIVLVSIRKYY